MLEEVIEGFRRTGKIAEDVPRFLGLFECQKTAEHCQAVAAKAKELAERFNVNPSKAESAGYLHDISVVIPNEKRVEFAHSQMVEVLAEEARCPMIIHQKLSVVIAKEVFGVVDDEVLSAVGCHTTLKAESTRLDKVVFLADKISWDRAENPPYLDQVNRAMEQSLEAAALEYLDYLWQRSEQLQVIHPWFIKAREDLQKP